MRSSRIGLIGEKNMLTRKHYKAIAEIIKNWDASAGKENLIDALVDYLRYDNSQFNAETFREACKPSDRPKRVASTPR